MSFVVRRVGTAEVEVLKATRLAALLDTPSAFGSTYAAEVAQPDDYWEQRAARASGMSRLK